MGPIRMVADTHYMILCSILYMKIHNIVGRRIAITCENFVGG